jgi:hypothetical protein
MGSNDRYDERTYGADEVYDEGAHPENRKDAEYDEDDYEYANAEGSVVEDDGSFLGESLAWLLFLSGLALFLFPEPATSTLGVGLMVASIVVWIADALF